MSKRIKVMSVFGTRPEAIKMAPVVQALDAQKDRVESLVCVTAQHRAMLDQVLRLFEIEPDIDLNLMLPNQDLYQLTSRVLLGMQPVLNQHQPDMVLVHGDTTTTMATALSCYYAKIPIGHVEAGLRTFDPYYPFPEEINRVFTDTLAAFHFAPTQQAATNLQTLGVKPNSIHITGNTVIDALFYTLDHTPEIDLPFHWNPDRKLILATVHRRENFGPPLIEICQAIKTLIETESEVELVLPVHPNPNVQQTVYHYLKDHERIHLVEPMDYAQFCHVMNRSYFILTDSGGVQEEAPSLKKPVFVLRDETERPEAIEQGVVQLIGPHYDKILDHCRLMLHNPQAYNDMASGANPYGDGHAAKRIVDCIVDHHFSKINT